MKIKEVILQKNTEIQDCFKIEKKLSDLIKTIQEKNSKKNELNLMFVDENKNIINPELNVNSDSYTIKSIIYFKKTKIHQIELIDKERNYFYFNFDPNHVTIGE